MGDTLNKDYQLPILRIDNMPTKLKFLLAQLPIFIYWSAFYIGFNRNSAKISGPTGSLICPTSSHNRICQVLHDWYPWLWFSHILNHFTVNTQTLCCSKTKQDASFIICPLCRAWLGRGSPHIPYTVNVTGNFHRSIVEMFSITWSMHISQSGTIMN